MAEQHVYTAAYNRDLIYRFYDLGFNEKRSVEAAEAFISDDFLEHNPIGGNGIDGFVRDLGGFVQGFPDQWSNAQRILTEGDLVFLHNNLDLGSDHGAQAVGDIFRLRDGRIVEHWDTTEELKTPVPNSDRLFSGPRVPLAVAESERARNKQVVSAFLTAVFAGPVAELPEVVSKALRTDFAQHGSSYGDGVDAFAEGLARIRTEIDGLRRGKFRIARLVADGSFVVAQTFTPYAPDGAGDHSGRSTMNIFHLDNAGEITHHWETVELIPAETKSGNSAWDDGR